MMAAAPAVSALKAVDRVQADYLAAHGLDYSPAPINVANAIAALAERTLIDVIAQVYEAIPRPAYHSDSLCPRAEG